MNQSEDVKGKMTAEKLVRAWATVNDMPLSDTYVASLVNILEGYGKTCVTAARESVNKELKEFIRRIQYGYDWGSDRWCASCGSIEGEDHTEDCELIKILSA